MAVAILFDVRVCGSFIYLLIAVVEFVTLLRGWTISVRLATSHAILNGWNGMTKYVRKTSEREPDYKNETRIMTLNSRKLMWILDDGGKLTQLPLLLSDPSMRTAQNSGLHLLLLNQKLQVVWQALEWHLLRAYQLCEPGRCALMATPRVTEDANDDGMLRVTRWSMY